MAYNLGQYDTSKMSFGTGVLLAAPWKSGKPEVDPAQWYQVGLVESAEMSVAREKIEFEGGTPKVKIAEYSLKETVDFTANVSQWDKRWISWAIGGTYDSATDALTFGSSFDLGETMSLRFVHEAAAGGNEKVIIDIWKAVGKGEINFSFGDEKHGFPMGFSVLNSTYTFNGDMSNLATIGTTTAGVQAVRSNLFSGTPGHASKDNAIYTSPIDGYYWAAEEGVTTGETYSVTSGVQTGNYFKVFGTTGAGNYA